MNKVMIIAEAGVNHNGSIAIAKELIDKAKEAGADIVKFQTFKAEKLVSKNAEKAAYQKETTGASESQFDMIKRLELNLEMHKELIEYCIEKEINFLSTPFDEESARLLVRLGIDIIKIPSGEITNLPYLRVIGGLHKKVILSTGMSTMEEVQCAVQILTESGAPEVIVLHCNTEYPTPMQDVNLVAMNTIKQVLNVDVGYSDHTLGIEVPIAAVALGARIIEKHFTLDKKMEGPDHRASLEPHELAEMVRCIRNIEAALGTGVKRPSGSELKNKDVARKSIVANCNIDEGQIFNEDNLAVKRPGTGISPMKWDEVLGKRAKRNFKEDELIEI